MRILINREECVDLESPIYLSEDRRSRFIEGLRRIFPNLKTHEVIELDRDTSEVQHNHPKKWKPKELILLFSGKSHKEIATILGREEFSVKSKRGVWLLPFVTWARKKGFLDYTAEVIEEYERSKRE